MYAIFHIHTLLRTKCICCGYFLGQLIHFHKHANQNKRTFRKRKKTFKLENSLSPLSPPLQLVNVRVSFTFQTTEKKNMTAYFRHLSMEFYTVLQKKKKYIGIMLTTMSRRNLISFIFGPLDWVSISIYNPSRHSLDLDYGQQYL